MDNPSPPAAPSSSSQVAAATPAAPPANPVKTTISRGFIGILKIAAKHFPIIMGVYLMGYFNVSTAWVIGIVGLTSLREQWRKERDFRMSAARAAAMFDEKEVILARVADLPSWVFFPDFDRAEWLNKILKQVWPNLGHYVRNIIVELVEPGIRESLQGYKLGGFKLDKISLGTIPLRVGGIKVYEKNISRSEIIMDVEVFYAGDCDIRFSVKGLKGGVKDFQLSGMLRVVLKPLISQIPLVGGFQLFFLNSPTVDFNLIGVADVLDMPGLSEILRRVILDQLGAFLVLPNKLSIQLSDIVPPLILKMPEPAGVLRIRVIEAKQLMKMDVGVLGMGKSDPYAIITVGSQEFRTKTINNTINPKWDFYCEFVVGQKHGQFVSLEVMDQDDSSRSNDLLGRKSRTVPFSQGVGNNAVKKAKVESLRAQVLFIQVWDYDAGFPGVQNDDYLGRATVDIYSVAKEGKKDMWVTLEDVKTGMVHLELTWFNLSDDPSPLKLHMAETQSLGLSSAVLIVYVDSAKFLPCARTTSKPDPYVVVTVGNRNVQTSVRMRTIDPVYEQAFTFLVCNPESDDLYFKVMDQKTGSELGMKKVTLVTLLTQPGMEMCQQPLTLKNSGPESKLLVSVRLKVMVPGQPIKEETPQVSPAPLPAPAPPPANPSAAKKEEKPIKKEVPTDEPKAAAAATLAGSATPTTDTSPNGDKEHEAIKASVESVSSAVPPSVASAKALDRESSLRKRKAGLSSGAVSQVQLTLRFSSQRQRLVVVVHKAVQLPGGDLPDLPDPYVKLYLLPDHSAASKRKTEVVKDSVNPVFDETFEYTVAPQEIASRELELSVINRKGLFARSPLMGQTKIPLAQFDLSQAVTQWFDLALPE